MRRDWMIRFSIACAVLSVLSPGAVQVFGQAPAADTSSAVPGAASAIRWADVCSLSLVDNKIALRTDLSIEQLRSLTPEMTIDGMPGKTTIVVSRRSFLVRNKQERPGGSVQLTISASSSALSIEMQLATPDEIRGVVLYQPGSGSSTRINRGVRLTIYGQETMTYEAGDLEELRAQSPHVVNRHLRPALRALNADLLQVDPAAARQVLLGSNATDLVAATQPATGDADHPAATRPAAPSHGPAPEGMDGWPASTPLDPRLMLEVRRLLLKLNGENYRHRGAAAQRLLQIGPPAAVVIGRMDRIALSAEQNLALDLFLATVHPLEPEAAQRARRDPHFLLDCLYIPDASIRAVAVDRLVRVTKQRALRFKPVLRLDPVRDADEVAAAIEDLRDGLVQP